MAHSSITNPQQVTTSNVYLAFGLLNDQPVMKIGKANDVLQRQRQIGIGIEMSCACDSEKEAFQLETKLRRLMRSLGAERVATRMDWHVFDATIYERVKEMFTDEFGVQVLKQYKGRDGIEDFEVDMLRARYRQMPKYEPVVEAKVVVDALEVAERKLKDVEQQIVDLRAEREAWILEGKREAIRMRTDIAVMESELYFWRRGILTLDDVVKELPDVA